MSVSKSFIQSTVYEKSDLTLLYWGKEACLPGKSFGPGIREMYKIHFIHAGKGIVKTRNQTHSLREGQGFLVYPHVITYYEADATEPWTYSWIAFHGAQIPSILARTALTQDAPVFTMDTDMMPTLYDQLADTRRLEETGDLRQKAVMYEFFSRLIHQSPPALSTTHVVSKIDRYILQAKNFITSHYAEPITIQQIASSLGLDRKYFSALFKQATGVPPQSFLIHYRMKTACDLLAQGHYSIEEIAHSVGYSDGLLFSKMFKRTIGQSPSQYRSSHLKSDIMP